MSTFAAIEAGGTKFVCGVGSAPGELETASFPTTTPAATVVSVVAFIRDRAGAQLTAAGIGSFGPVDLDRDSATYGHITSTPKLPWRNFDLRGEVARALRVPVGFDTDVNAAALGEALWGAGQGLEDFVYLTIGTGIGGAAMANGRAIHGLSHPEMGHIRIPQDRSQDDFAGVCPYHGDCLEGLASGPAIEKRWGKPARELDPDHPAWALEAHYLALALVNWICTLSPRRIIIGGGVMQRQFLFPIIRAEVIRLLNGYLQLPDEYIVPPALGNRAGLLGAFALAASASQGEGA